MKSNLLVLAALTVTVFGSATGYACDINFYGKDESFEKVLGIERRIIESRGVALEQCNPVVKDAVDVDAKALISDGYNDAYTRGFKTTSIYSCKSKSESQIFIIISRFQPIETPRYNGFNGGSRGPKQCPGQKGAFVSAEVP